MSKLYIHNSYCSLDNETDLTFISRLDQELSYRVQGAEYTRKFKGFYDRSGNFVKWDGRRRFLTNKLNIPRGLRERVIEFYEAHDKPLEIIDCRPDKSPSQKIDILPALKAVGKSPFPHQLVAVEAVKNHDQGIIRMPTGSGKTIVAAMITAEFGKRTIIYVIGKDLLYQMHELFSSLFNQKIGIIGDGQCEIADINIASVWTIGQAVGLKKNSIINDSVGDESQTDPQRYQDIRDLLKTAKVHLWDECHISACSTIQEIGKKINPEHIYGMSASPWRDDNADLLIECILGKYIVNISASELIKGGYLVQPIIRFLNVPPPIEKLTRHYQSIYSKYVIENPERNGMITLGTQKLVEQGYQTLVLFNNIKHGNILYDEISKKIPCILLNGNDSAETRQDAKKKLECGEINCIIASRIFDIGVDLPSLSGLVVAGSGKSSVRALQRIGRVIRKYPNKKQAVILDFVDNVTFLKNHSKARKKIYSSEKGFIVEWPK